MSEEPNNMAQAYIFSHGNSLHLYLTISALKMLRIKVHLIKT